MYSNDRYRVPETSPSRRYSDQRMSASSRPLPSDPRDSVRPQSRRNPESDRRGLEMDRRESRDRNESFGRRSQEFDYDRGHQPERRDFERRMEDEGKRKMAEELKIREQQLAITSNLLQKQSQMLKNMEANIMTRNQPAPSPMMGRNMGPPGLHMGPMDMRPNSRSPRRKFEFNNEMDKGRYDGPPPKRFKEIEQGDRSNWKKASQSRGGMTRAGGHMKGGPVVEKLCYICNSSNHLAKFCPKSTKGHEGNGPSLESKSPGHLSKSDGSTNIRVDNGKLCNICKSPNHFQRNCPQKSPQNQFSGPKRDDTRSVGFNKPYGTSSRFTGARGGRYPFKSDQFRKKFVRNGRTKACKICSIPNVNDFEAHIKTPEHSRLFDLCKSGCKLCNKKRYNSRPQYEKHQISTLHKALVGKKKLVVESKLKPYASSNTSGVEYVVPVSGFFCKLCKKFYNKEAYAKVDHCKTKAHYDKVASMIGTKFETAIGARFQEIKDKLSEEVTDQYQLERKLIEAVRKADFVTDLKPIPKTVVSKTTTEANKPAETTDTPAATTEQPKETTEKPTETTEEPSETVDKPTETTEKPAETTEAPAEETTKTEEEDMEEETTEDAQEESEEKPVAEDDGDHEHPDDLEMEVLDDAGGDDGVGAD